MNTPRAVTAGDRHAGAQIEYVKSRGVLRLAGWRDDGEGPEPVEVPLLAFLERLDIDVRALDVPRRYLVFAGHGRPGGGLRDLTAVFDHEEEARAEFHGLRSRRRSTSWAQVVVLDHRGRSRPLCWFDPDVPVVARADDTPTRGRRWRGRARP